MKQFGFINKQGIIREKSVPTECSDAVQVYNIQDKQIIKYKDMVQINDEEPEETTPINFVERDFSHEPRNHEHIFITFYCLFN